MSKADRSLKILMFGATGRTGSLLVQMALNAGHQVTAIVRSPGKLKVVNPCLIVKHSDITDIRKITSSFHNQDVVISCIGVSSIKPTTVYSKGIANILAAMKEHNITRIISISAAAIETSPRLPLVLRLISKYLVQRIFRHPYSDVRKMEALLRESNTDWTCVRPPVLKNKPFTGNYRYSINGWLEKCFSINRADLAYFLLSIIDDRQTYKSVVEVAN